MREPAEYNMIKWNQSQLNNKHSDREGIGARPKWTEKSVETKTCSTLR